MRNLVHTINTLQFKRRCNAALLCSDETSAHAQLIIFGATKMMSRGTNTAHATLQSSSQGEKDSTSVALSS